jgi:DNA-binding response OmpR family regulator
LTFLFKGERESAKRSAAGGRGEMTERVAFGSCELDPTKRLLLLRGKPVEAEAKAFGLPVYLIEHRDRVET